MKSGRTILLSRRSQFEQLEIRRLLASDIGRQPYELDGQTPYVAEVLLKSPSFTQPFVDHVFEEGLGSADGHVRVEDLEATFPWAVSEIRLQFSKDVDVVIGDLELRGENAGPIEPTDFMYNAAEGIATWIVPELDDDKFSINLSNHIQARVGGRFLDGDTTGDTDDATPFYFRFSTLAADLNRDGFVSAGDLGPFRDSFGQFIGSDNYNIYHDANADGFVSAGDLGQFRDNFGDFLPAEYPASQASTLLPGLSKPEIGSVDEDSGPFEFLLDVNSSASEDADLQFTIESTDPSLIDASKAAIETRGDHFELVFDPEQDQFGTAQLTVGVTDAAGTTSLPFDVVVDAVNDAPFVTADPPEVTLTHGRPDRTLVLDEYFDDVDDPILTYSLASYNSQLVTASIENGELTLTGVDGRTGDTLVVVEATDAAGLSVSAAVQVIIDRPSVEPLTEVQYSLTSDQIVEFQGQNTFILTTSFNESSRIGVESTNSSVISENDVIVTPLGNGQHRVIVRHASDDYGLAFLQFTAEGVVFADIAVVVLPDPDDDSGESNGNETIAGTDYVHRLRVEEGNLVIENSFDDRYMARHLRDELISSDDFFSLVKPTTSVDMMSVHAWKDGNLTQSFFTQTTDGAEIPSTPKLRGGITVRAIAPVGKTAEVHQSFVTPSGIRYDNDLAQKNAEQTWQVIADAYNPFTRGGAFNIAGTTLAAVSLFTPATAPFGAAYLAWKSGSLLGEGLAKGRNEYRISTRPSEYSYSKEEIAAHYRTATVGVAVVDTVMSIATSGPGYLGQAAYHSLLVGTNVLLANVSLVNTVLTVSSDSATKERMASKAVEEVDKLEGLETDLNAVLPSLRGTIDAIKNDIAENPDSQFADADVAQLQSKIDDLTEVQVALAERKGQLTDALERGTPEDVVIIVNPELDVPDIANDESTAEGLGTNGDEQDLVNEKIIEVNGDKHERLKSAISAGKKLYDIAKLGQAIVGQVGQLFESASSNEYAYTDNDGRSYNLYVAQRGDAARQGTADRDVINTSYLNDQVYGYGGDDRINSQDGNDELYGGAGRNTYFAGAGNDLIVDESGGSHISAGEGDDTVYPGPGSDLIDAGTGHDTIIFEGTNLGNNLVADPSRSGVLRFTGFSIDQLTFRKDKNDLEILAPVHGGRITDSVKIAAYFEQDAAGWEVIDSLGNRYNLYELTGRITSYDALQIAFADRDASGVPVYPTDVIAKSLVTSNDGQIRVHVAEDRRLIGTNSGITQPGLVLTFEGDSTLSGWLNRNQFAALSRATPLLPTLLPTLDLGNYDRVSVVGIGEGGLIAQWFNAVAATSGVSFVNAHLINTPDISGVISQVVRGDVIEPGADGDVVLASGFPEFVDGFPVLSTNYLVDYRDWISQIGIWAGNDELYATWKAFTFNKDTLLGDQPVVIDLPDLEAIHHPTGDNADFRNLDISDMQLSQIRGVVSLTAAEDFNRAFANIDVLLNGEQFDSTTNARIVLSNGDETATDSEFDIDDDTRADRIALLAMMSGDPTAADADDPYQLQLDFQASEQLGEHLAFGYTAVTENTLYTGVIGWDSLVDVKAGADKGKASSLERDSVKVQEGTFIVDLAGTQAHPGPGPGTYNISITVGDREEIQESLQVSINGYQADRVSTMPGDFLTRTYQVNVLESQLRIEFLDIGGQHDYFSVNGISVEKVNYRSYIAPTETLDNDPSVVVMTQSYELPETSAGIEIYKEALKAAAVAALSAGAGAILQAAGNLGGVVAHGLGGSFKAGALAAEASKAGITHSIASTIGTQAASAAGWSLVTSVPQNFVPSATARGILSGGTSIFFGVRGIDQARTPVKGSTDPRDILGITKGALQTISGGLTIANASAAAIRGGETPGNTAPWIYEVVNSLAKMTQRYRLGKLNTAFVPVDLDEVEDAIAAGKTPKQLLKRWQGSRDFLVLDWVPTRDKLTEIDVNEHRDYVKRTSKVLKKLLEAYAEQIQEQSPETELDVLFIGHGAGYEVNRETANRLNVSDSADAFDYVKFVTLDPYASSQDAFTWYHPEMTNIVDRVDNIYQTEEVDSSLWLAALTSPVVLIGSDPGGSDLYHGGSDLGGLDGREGGGAAGFYNRQARVFDLASTYELLRFRHWDTNKVELSTAELTDIEFSPDGTLVAASGKDGMVTVRYVDDAPEPDPETGKLPYRAGDVKFIVWGQESKVRSVAFMQMEVEGVWQDYLLTISAANNPENTDIDKNKVLLTDVETGLPVWQGKDVAGTQVEASPSGRIIVSTDSKGQAKVWKRVGDSVTFYPLPNLVEAHTGPNSDYIADVLVINDEYFVTAGLDGRMKLFRIADDGGQWVQTEIFDNPTEGRVRNLDYDPYNGLLAVGAGQELSLWRFNQALGILAPFAPAGQQAPPKFSIHDHVGGIQGVAFSKPSFLLDSNGLYGGDRTITMNDGTVLTVPRREGAGDIDLALLPSFLADNDLPSSYSGLKLLTGGEDKTLFLYTLDSLNIGSIREESVLSGSMLPVREVTISPDGRRVAVVGEDNIDGDDGGPVKDIDVTAALDDRLGWTFSELFLQGRREHNAVPQQYIYDIVEQKGESYFWMRNSGNANRPGDLDKSKNLALPPNKRDNIDGVDIAPIDLYLRPGKEIEIFPLQWLLEVDRKDFSVKQETLVLGDVTDVNDDERVIGTIKLKRSDSGQIRPNTFVFEAADNLDYTLVEANEFVGKFHFDINGPTDIDGNAREIQDAEITFRIINHKPTTYRDIVNLHPNREEIDLRPRANDYDFDNDDFGIIPVSSTWQPLEYGNEEVARYRRHPDPDHNRGIDIEALVSEDRLATLLEEQRASDEAAGRPVRDYISVEFDYQVKEDRYNSISTGTVEVRLQLQAGPENVRFSELGADQVLIEWEPVTWSANKYVIEGYETRDGVLDWYKHSTNSDVDGNQADSLRIKITPNTDYWFRVVAKNTNSGREHASYEGTDRALMLHVPATDYVGPGSVSMESLGPAQIEVRWEKVFWDVDRYRIDLHQLVVGDDGLPLRGSDGSYEYVDGKSTFDVVQKGDGLRVVFKRLDTSKPYLAIVTAKNTNGSVEQPTFAAVPVFTGERQLPAGINDERIGPEKMRISWGTVDYADKYRVVAIAPITLERIPSEVQDADNSKNTNDLVLEGLSKSSTYVIIVEARTKKTKEWITLIDDDPQTPILPNRDILADDISAAVNAGVASTYIIPSDFSHSITVPSLEGQFVTAEFTFLNFSRQSITVTATDGTIQFPSSNNNVQTLPAAFGDDGDGAIVYRFIARERNDQLGTLYWEVQIGDELSEARAFSTPAFLAAEPSDSGELLRKSDDSLPKQLKIDWTTPFWDVNRHRIEIFNYDEATGAETPIPGVPAKTKYLSELTGKDRTHTFKGLTPATQYLVRLTTVGDGKTLQTERLLSTDAQESPSEVRAENVTLRSFEAKWNELRWNVNAFRVSFAEIGADGQTVESTRDYRGANADKTSKLVEGLKSGVEYSFTVEAQNQEGDWIPNTNIKTVKTLVFELPSEVYLTSPGNAPHQIQLDWSYALSKETNSGFRFGADSVTVRWREAGATGNGRSDDLSGSASSYTITGITRGQDYEVLLEFRANGIGEPLELRTEGNEPLSTTPASPPTELAFSDETRGSFRMSWVLPDGNDHDWYNATVSLDNGATWRNTQRSNGGSGNGMNRDLTTVVLAKYQTGDGSFTSFKANTTYLVRLAAVYDNGDSRAFTNESGDSVTTADYVTPSNVRGSNPTETTILLEWDFSDPIGLPDKFAIEYSKNGGATWPYKEGAGNTLTSKLIDNLEPGETYIFRVTSEYASGEDRTSSNSDPVSTSDLQLALTNIVVDGKRKATVHWQALAAEPHTLFIEVLQLDENGNAVGTWTTPSGGEIVNDKSQTSKQITELLPGTSYRVRLVAANSQGDRTESAELTFATEAYPPITGLGVSLPTKQGATVEWIRLETLDSDANVTENVIEVFLNNALVANPRTGSGSGNKHSFKLTGLQPGLAYEFRIVAFNGSVKLSQSARMEFFTLVDGLTVDEITQTTARANWTQFAGGGATDYRVKVLIPGTNTVIRQKMVSIGSGIRRTTMDGLSAQTNYEMIVEVLKNNTVLSYSNRASFRTADAATAPTNVQLSPNKWRALNVMWNAPSNWTPNNYTVRVYTTSGQLVSQTSTSGTSMEVTSLTVGTSYYAIVTANGSQGNIPSARSGNVSTFGLAAPTNFNVTQASNVLTFRWNHHLISGLPSTGFHYRIERRGGDGDWKRVNNNPISGTVNATAQSFNIQRQNAGNFTGGGKLDKGKTYDFRVVAVYNNNLTVSNTFTWRVL